MKKGTLIIGKRKLGRNDELEKVLTAELGTNRESIRVDEIDSQHVIMDGMDERLGSTTLTELTTGIWKLMPHARIVATLDSIESLSNEDLKYAQEHFDILFGINNGRFVEFNEDEIILDGLPIRMYIIESSYSTPQFFRNINENTLHQAMVVLKALHGNDVTLEHLNELLHNTSGNGEKMVLQTSKTFSSNKFDEKVVEDACRWFMQDYFTGAKGSRMATRTYEYAIELRYLVNRLYHQKH